MINLILSFVFGVIAGYILRSALIKDCIQYTDKASELMDLIQKKINSRENNDS